MAFGVLADVATGVPLLIRELALTTAMRIAATSAVTARALARPDSRVMTLIGNGAQSEFQALAFHHLVGIEEIRLFDTDARATAKLMRNLQSNPDAARLRLIACASTAEAVRGADIITTVTTDKTNATIVTADMLAPGIEGDLQQMADDFTVTKLWQVLSDQKPGRDNDAQITMFDSVGFATKDFSALRYVHDLAQSLGLGAAIPLIP